MSSITERFIQTAVIVDNEASTNQDEDKPKANLLKPNRKTGLSKVKNNKFEEKSSNCSLDAIKIMNSFSELGIICGVVDPTGAIQQTVKKADIVVLDWYLKDRSYVDTLKILNDLVENSTSLRLIAIYTGDHELERITKKIYSALDELNLSPKNQSATELIYQYGCVVVYNKFGGVRRFDKNVRDRSVSGTDLPNRLLRDFSKMTEGLLPNLVLTSLAAVREETYKILERFSKDLDPAYLTQIALFSRNEREDSEQQIVNLIAEEIRGIMSNDINLKSPAGKEAIENWVHQKHGVNQNYFQFENKPIEPEKIIGLINHGISSDKINIENLSTKKKYKELTNIFSNHSSTDANNQLDERLAWLMSYRTVMDINSHPPTLWLGTVVTDEFNEYLLCIKPRCDAVRIEKNANKISYLFLRLVEPKNNANTSIVVKTIDNSYKLRQVDLENFCTIKFKPSLGKNKVEANDLDFISTGGKYYRWMGELNTEFAHHIANKVAGKLGRVALSVESKWIGETIKRIK